MEVEEEGQGDVGHDVLANPGFRRGSPCWAKPETSCVAMGVFCLPGALCVEHDFVGVAVRTQETPNLLLTIRKLILQDAKTAPTARSPTHSLGVDKGDMEVQKLLASNQRNLLTIQKLESGN